MHLHRLLNIAQTACLLYTLMPRLRGLEREVLSKLLNVCMLTAVMSLKKILQDTEAGLLQVM